MMAQRVSSLILHFVQDDSIWARDDKCWAIWSGLPPYHPRLRKPDFAIIKVC